MSADNDGGVVKFHEDLHRDEEVVGSSDRNFGLTFAGIFLLLAGLKFWVGKLLWGALWLAISTLFGGVAQFKEELLQPLNKAWTQLGMVLYKIVNPIVMAAIFLLAIVPVGLLMRVVGKDPLRLRWERDARSYWIMREPPGPDPKGMTQQF